VSLTAVILNISLTLLLSLAVVNAADTTAPDGACYIAIIIDDLGYKPEQDQRALSLPGDYSYAFLPHAPLSRRLAENAHAANKDVILHLPMQSFNNGHLGPGGLTIAMDKPKFVRSLLDSISSIPHLNGVNNHMGSLMTSREQPMLWLMETLKQQQLYFVDSRTSNKSIAQDTASNFGVSHTRRNVFLDHTRNTEDILIQFRGLIRLARKYGTALGIAHPYKQTLDVLETQVPLLKSMNIKLVSTSTLIRLQQHQDILCHQPSSYL